MSKTNGEKARANLAKRARTAQREKDRARLAQLKRGDTQTTQQSGDDASK
jgi:hypothetical protein